MNKLIQAFQFFLDNSQDKFQRLVCEVFWTQFYHSLLNEIINKNSGLNVDELHQKVKWTRKKITRYANKLVRDKKVMQPKYFPTPFKDLINWDEMKYTKKPID